MANTPKNWVKYVFISDGDMSVGIPGLEMNLEIVGLEKPDEEHDDLRKAIEKVIEEWSGDRVHSMTQEEMKAAISSENKYYEGLVKQELEFEASIKQNEEDLQDAILERRKLDSSDFTEGLD